MNKETSGKSELQAARRTGLKLLSPVFLFSIFVNVLMLTGPLFMMQVYDRVLSSRSEETLVTLFLLVGVLYALMGFLDYARGRVLARFGARFQNALDRRVFVATLTSALNPQVRAAPTSGLRDIETLQRLFASPAMLAIFDVPWTPLFIGAIFIFHPYLGWMAIFGGAVLILVTLLNNRLTSEKSLVARKTAQYAHSFSEQARLSSEIVQSQGMTSAFSMRWEAIREAALGQSIYANDWSGLFTAFTKTFRLFLQSAMLAVGAWLALKGSMTPGAMIAGTILLGRALAPIEQSIGQWPLIQSSIEAWKSLSKFLDETPSQAETIELPKPTADVFVKGLSVLVAGVQRPILTNLSFSLSQGQVTGIIGKSGSGKSSLAKALLGIMRPASGEIRLGGATLEQYAIDDLGSYIGYLPQHVTLFNGTVAENISRMSIQPEDAKIIEAARRANAHQMILDLPEGYKTMVHGQDSQLSGGQRQRIALARALYNDPVLLVLDEPNSALDSEGSAALNKAIREFKETQRSVIIMTHRPNAIAECDNLIVLEAGRISAEGSREEILKTILRKPEKDIANRKVEPVS